MKQTPRNKPLFASTSFQTNCTFEESNEKGIKINVIHPQRKSFEPQNGSEDCLTYSQDSAYVLSQSLKKPLQPAITVHPTHKPLNDIKKKPSNSFESYHQQNLQNLNKNNRIIENLPQNPSNLSKNVYVSINNVTDQKFKITSSAFKEKQKIPGNCKDHLIEIAQKLAQKTQNNEDLLIDISQDESIQNLNQSQIIDIDQKSIIESQSKKVTTNKTHIFFPISIQNMQKRPSKVQSIQTDRHTSQNRSNSKLKLRDYLYMVEATSKQSSLNKSRLREQRNNESLGQTQIKIIPKVQIQKKEPTQSQIERSSLINHRKEHAMFKYSISNTKMYDILKKEIHEDIKNVQKNLQKVDKEIVDLKIEGQTEPTNEELLILYTIRRQIKEQINKKLEQTLKMIKDHKKGIAIDRPDQILKRRPTNNQDKNPC